MNPEFLYQIGEMVLMIIVFLAFFWVLKKAAWKPILETLDERQKKIQDGFDEVKQLQVDAAEAHQRYEEKLRDIEAEARSRIQEAVTEGRRVATEVTEKARADATEITEKAKQNIQLEIQTARKQLKEEIIELTLHATERLIRERLDEAKDKELVSSFISEMEEKPQ